MVRTEVRQAGSRAGPGLTHTNVPDGILVNCQVKMNRDPLERGPLSLPRPSLFLSPNQGRTRAARWAGNAPNRPEAQAVDVIPRSPRSIS